MASRSKQKGSKFERDISRELSWWWSCGESEDWFWRSQSSGARATQRAKTDQTTQGQYGDVASTHPASARFIEYMPLEVKVGYNKATIHELMDLDPDRQRPTYEDFLQQAIEASENSGSETWGIIHRRDQRQPILTVPAKSWKEWCIRAGGPPWESPIFRGKVSFRRKYRDEANKVVWDTPESLFVAVVPWACFLDFHPDHVCPPK